MRKYTLLSSLVLLGSLSLMSACAGGSAESSGSDSSAAHGGASPAPSSETATVDPAKIKGLNVVNDSSNDRSCPWATSYPDVPGAKAMTAAMRADVQGYLDGYLGKDSSGQATACGGAATSNASELPELNISFSMMVASGDVLGVRLLTQNRMGTGDGLTTKTYWYDGAAAKYRTTLDLVADGSRDAFTKAVKDQLKQKEGIDLTLLDQLGASEMDDASFTSGGDLKITFDRGSVGVPAAGRMTVTLPEATVSPWLSDLGKRAQKQTTDPSGTLDLGATSTPAASVPTESATGNDTTDCAEVKCIALTFDDGPAAPETATLLKYLAQYKARVTFFTVGQNVAAHPELVRAEAKAGHEVGNHSWSHPDLTRLTPAQVRQQLERTTAAIKAATGKAPTLFRPPYGAVNAQVKAATTLSPVLWDVDTEDWKYRDSAKVAQTVITKASRNDVVLMHDIHPTSVAAVPEILRTLTDEGFHFVTVSHLRATL
ncbi:polysaccharide deacetylase family protein [Streptomyces sp. GQFP]|uniref:polysaccharide deacetylase family protein n=1 Tax=Streptomyces sp. GQFP TaxID=2907545 RepID=UPI001F2249B1|nr:polysaccharide deacetylase family protein [Streptomyces sp. GQFP]UIX29238.1 polysaccharide deacetylase family protein [Streptomyces sp. GQFP]